MYVELAVWAKDCGTVAAMPMNAATGIHAWICKFSRIILLSKIGTFVMCNGAMFYFYDWRTLLMPLF